MNDRSQRHPVHYIDRAAQYGQHSFVAVHVDEYPDASVWECQRCNGRILGYQLEDNLWQLELGATCPTFALLLTDYLEESND